MNQMVVEPTQHALSRRLLERLTPLVSQRDNSPEFGLRDVGDQFVAYCALERERIAPMRTEVPLIGVVLRGEKQFWQGDVCHSFLPGQAFVFPGQVDLTVINILDERSGRYEAVFLKIVEVPPGLARPRSNRVRSELITKITLTEDITEALIHAAVLRTDQNNSEQLAAHRMQEVLMLIADQPAAANLLDASVAAAAASVILAHPTRDWTAAALAARLGMGGSTLRRRLTSEGTSLRRVLRETRMSVAHQLLSSGSATVSQAAEAAGYASRSHFARAFRAAYGVEPRGVMAA